MTILYVRCCLALLYIIIIRKSASDILISELNASDPYNGFGNQQEFIELVNINSTSHSLTDYYLVYYNGETNPPKAYEVIDLSGYCINGYETLVLGRTNVSPTPDIIVSNIQDGRATDADAIVLYYNTVPGIYDFNLKNLCSYSNSTILFCIPLFIIRSSKFETTKNSRSNYLKLIYVICSLKQFSNT